MELEKGVQRWIVDVSNWEPSSQHFSLAMSFLPHHEHSSITRFVKLEDRIRALVSRLLQYALVHQVLGIPFDEIIIRRTPEGKPFLSSCRYWCLKEAFVKAIGTGVGYKLDDVEFHHTSWENIFVKVAGKELKDWKFWLLELGHNHSVSIARGHPRTATPSYIRTLKQTEFDDKEYNIGLHLPNASFTFLTVDDLVQLWHL